MVEYRSFNKWDENSWGFLFNWNGAFTATQFIWALIGSVIVAVLPLVVGSIPSLGDAPTWLIGLGLIVVAIGILLILWIQLSAYAKRARGLGMPALAGAVIYIVPIVNVVFFLWSVVQAIIDYNKRPEPTKL